MQKLIEAIAKCADIERKIPFSEILTVTNNSDLEVDFEILFAELRKQGYEIIESDEDLSKISSKNEEKISLDNRNIIKIYLQEINGYPLLNFEQEKELAELIQDGLYAEEELEKYLEEVEEPRERITALFKSIIEKGTKARNLLVESNLRLVVYVAKSFMNRGLEFLDLIQEGNMGLMKAAKKYDQSKDFRFSTYATWWIRQTISRGISNTSKTIRIPVHLYESSMKVNKAKSLFINEYDREPSLKELSEASGISIRKIKIIDRSMHNTISLETKVGKKENGTLADLIPSEVANPEDYLKKISDNQIIQELFDVFPEREQKIMAYRFGFAEGGKKTLLETGKILGITKERVRQIEGKIIEKLRTPELIEKAKGLL